MYLKDFVYGLCILIIPLILILLLHRLYIANKCHNNKECIKKKMLVDIDTVNNKLITNINFLKNNQSSPIETEAPQEEIEGFFGGLTDWLYNKTSGAPVEQQYASPTNTLNPSETNLKAANSDQNIIPQLNTKFPNQDINDSSNEDLLNSINKKNDTLKNITNKKLNSDNPISNIKNMNNGLKKEINNIQKFTPEIITDESILKNQENPPVPKQNNVQPSDPLKNKLKEISNIKETNKPLNQEPIKPKVSSLFNQCNFYSDKCPNGYNDFGTIGLSGMDKNVMLSCGNVENTKPAKAIAKIKNHALDEVVIIDKGHGFNPQNPPKVTIVGGKGNGAECESVIDDDGFLSLIKIKHPGNLYTETPNVIIEPPLMNSSCHFCCK